MTHWNQPEAHTMFCPHCGQQITTDANFCSACGAGPARRSANAWQSRVVRPRYPRMIAGVCSGFALHYGWNIALVRVLAVLLTIATHGLGLIAYIAAWIILPEGLYALPPNGFRPVAPPQPSAPPRAS
jgi:phage shock protein C